MGARTYVDVTKEEFAELHEAFNEAAKVAWMCFETIRDSDKCDDVYNTDGIQQTIEGLDAVAKLMVGVVGAYRSQAPSLKSLREKVTEAKASKKTSKQIKTVEKKIVKGRSKRES